MRTMVAMALLAATLLATVASSEPPPGEAPRPAQPCTPSHIPSLGQACLRGDGLFDVVLADGMRLQTHGADPLLPRDAEGELGWDADAEQRPPVCAEEWAMHALYGHPAGTTDRLAQVTDDLRAALRRMNAVLNADALRSGGVTADFRVRCDAAGEIRIDSFTGPAPGDSGFGPVVDAARAAGFKAAHTDYVIFYEDSSTGVCGVGDLALDDRLAADNENLQGPDYGVNYETCWDGRTPMHENGHNQGAVQDLAPMWDATSHCLEGYDVMCYPGEDGVTGTATLGLVHQCSDHVHYDCNDDTYFDAAPEPGEWLATHWNIGSPLNKYLAFADTSSPRSGSAAAAAAANASASAPAPADNATSAPSPSPSGSTTSSATAKPTPTGSTRTTTNRVVADPRAAAPAASPGPAGPTGPVTIEIPGPAAWAVLAALGGAAALRRRLR